MEKVESSKKFANQKRKSKMAGIEIETISYDGKNNFRNPYDRLTPEERYEKIIKLLAKIYLKRLNNYKNEEQ